MAFTRLRLANFKSFEKVDVRLDPYNVLIGPNAAGKTNFVEAFRFLRDIVDKDLESAIFNQGGIEYLGNVNFDESKPISVHITVERTSTLGIKDIPLNFLIRKMEYKFKLKRAENAHQYSIGMDNLTTHVDILDINSKKPEIIGKGKFHLKKVKDSFIYGFESPSTVDIPVEKVLTDFPYGRPPENNLLIETNHFLSIPLILELKKIQIFNFGPKTHFKIQRGNKVKGLLEDGSNLPSIVNRIRSNKDEVKKFTNLVNYVLPYISEIKVDDISDDLYTIKFKETYTRDHDLPLSLISDGSINVVLLILALYFENREMIIIEEPDIGIHPKLISKVVSLIKETSQQRQVIVTTHNPEVVRHADLDHLLLINRDDVSGHSRIMKAHKVEMVRDFLEHEIGIQELFIDGLLEG